MVRLVRLELPARRARQGFKALQAFRACLGSRGLRDQLVEFPAGNGSKATFLQVVLPCPLAAL